MKIRMFISAAALVAGTGCTTAPPMNGPSSQALTIENLLRWPLEGYAGVARVMAGLRRAMPVRALQTPGQYSGQGPATLADGFVLSSASFAPGLQDISVGLSMQPCFTGERAVAITGATASPVVEDAHGVRTGTTYDAVRNGIRVRFTTGSQRSDCVKAIYVRKEG